MLAPVEDQRAFRPIGEGEGAACDTPAGAESLLAIRSDELERVQHLAGIAERQHKRAPPLPKLTVSADAFRHEIRMAGARGRGVGENPRSDFTRLRAAAPLETVEHTSQSKPVFPSTLSQSSNAFSDASRKIIPFSQCW